MLPTYPPIEKVQDAIKSLFSDHLIKFRQEVEDRGLEWNAETEKLDPWKGLYNYFRAEYRDPDGRLVDQDKAKATGARIWVWRPMPTGAPASKQAATTKDPDHHNYRGPTAHRTGEMENLARTPKVVGNSR